jgi:plastocyanin domain-containing protein
MKSGFVGGVQEVRVRVKGTYEPDVILCLPGRPLRITFRREETAACSERVVFPAFGKSAMLPPFQDVTIELRPEQAGEYEFTCQMGMLRGRILVSAEADGLPSGGRS